MCIGRIKKEQAITEKREGSFDNTCPSTWIYHLDRLYLTKMNLYIKRDKINRLERCFLCFQKSPIKYL